jgi:hypothetical protein
VVRTTTKTVGIHGIGLSARDLAIIAVVVIGLGGALGLFNAFATRRQPRGHLRGGSDKWRSERQFPS